MVVDLSAFDVLFLLVIKFGVLIFLVRSGFFDFKGSYEIILK